MSDPIDRQAAIDTIYAEFEYVYCFNCDHEGNEEWCEDCHRKYMKWSASRNTIERVLNGLPPAQPEPICVAKVTLTDEQVKEAFEKAKGEILTVLDAQPERKRGKWIERWHDNKHVIGDMACSVCGAQMLLTFPRFCPCCGAYMREEAQDATDCDADALQAEYKQYHDGKRLLLIDTAPTIKPRPRGRWVKISPANIYECSQCGKYVMTDDISEYDFCHGCGADMRKEEQDD